MKWVGQDSVSISSQSSSRENYCVQPCWVTNSELKYVFLNLFYFFYHMGGRAHSAIRFCPYTKGLNLFRMIHVIVTVKGHVCSDHVWPNEEGRLSADPCRYWRSGPSCHLHSLTLRVHSLHYCWHSWEIWIYQTHIPSGKTFFLILILNEGSKIWNVTKCILQISTE